MLWWEVWEVGVGMFRRETLGGGDGFFLIAISG